MNAGRIEQVGTPRELYDAPANEFVMKFVGPVTQLGEADVRPHDLDVLLEPTEGAEEMQVKRIVHLGFEVRVDLETGSGLHVWAQLTRMELEHLELEEGQIVWVRPRVRPRLAAVS
jgi:sulfate/thiosulfate transport system ATP-binding protein